MRNGLLGAALLLVARAACAYDLIQFPTPLPTEPALTPVSIAAAADRLYVLDEKKGVLGIYANDGKLLGTAGKSGTGREELSRPRRVAVGPDGTVFVADTGNSRVQMLDADGKFLGHFGVPGSDPGQLRSPQSVAVGADGRVYVADTGNARIQVFTREGVFLFGFGEKGSEPGKFKEPTGVVVDASDHIYVLDAGNARIIKFDPRTRLVKDFPLIGEHFTIDAYGFLYVLEPRRGKVKELNTQGALLGEFGSLGSGAGQFKKPSDVTVAPDGTILVADAGNGRIVRAALSTKSKTTKLSKNLAMKLFVSGPTQVFPYPASALAAWNGLVYAYLPTVGQFVALDEAGKERLRFGKKMGKDPSVTHGTKGFAVSPQFGIFVADEPQHRMQVFDAKGVFKSEFAQAQGWESRSKEGRLSSPGGVAINEKGTVYVADTGNARVSAFSPDGAFLFAFGPAVGPHVLKQPVAVAYDDTGFVYVLDRKLKKLFKCEPSGGFVQAWGEEGRGIGQFDDPVALAYDGKSYLYVLDQGNPRVSVFDKEGNWVTNFFAQGSDERSLKGPDALAVTGARLAVSDPAQNRILAFALRPRIAPPVAVTTSAVGGIVTLEWPEQVDPWIDSYRVYRSTSMHAPGEELGDLRNGAFKDSDAAGPQTYFYRVAVQATTGDLGPLSQPIPVYVPPSANRAAVEISTLTLGNIFSANYKWYLKNPLGRATLVNTTNMPFQSVKLSFQLKDFMDFATEQVVENLAPQQKVELPLMATLNNRILEVTEDTPIQAEFTVTYFTDGQKQTFSRTQALKVYSRNAITWEDPRRIANFITPKDPPVLDLGRSILRTAPKGPAGAENLDENLRIAMHVWDALGAIGVRFLPSPNNPFEKVSEDPAFPVDYTQFPRETLKRKSGECDDLVTLLVSMLEGATVKAAVLDYPGHLALMFDTGVSDPAEAGLPADLLIEYAGTLWVPLEATMVGAPFQEAVRKAAGAWREMRKAGKGQVTDPREAWQTYEPATQPTSEAAAEVPPAEDTDRRFTAEANYWLDLRFRTLTEGLRRRVEVDPKDSDALNELGIVCWQHGREDEALSWFNKAVEAVPGSAPAHNSLGNAAFSQGRYAEALEHYAKSAEADPEDPGVWFNKARAAHKAGQRAEAESAAKKAVALDPELEGAVQSMMK
ncbi:MAG: tetratricopeptide repeat protein [Elusimicrobiota bacterium]|jgi:DNA-binding beta-propeller fold protein YncE